MRHVTRPEIYGRCRWCGLEVLWLRYRTLDGRPAPIDMNPAPGGNILVDRKMGTYSIIAAAERTLFDATEAVGPDATPSLHMNHWATCSNATAQRLARERSKGGTELRTIDGDIVHGSEPEQVVMDGFAAPTRCGLPALINDRSQVTAPCALPPGHLEVCSPWSGRR